MNRRQRKKSKKKARILFRRIVGELNDIARKQWPGCEKWVAS